MTSLGIEFSEAMDIASVGLTLEPSVSLGEPSWSGDGILLEIAPRSALALGSSYTVQITGADRAGNSLAPGTTFAFTTTREADLAPSIVRTSPSNAASSVALDARISIEFSEAMEEGTLRVAIEPKVELGAPLLNDAATVLSFPSAQSFASETTYSVVVSGADRTGNTVSGRASFSFKTARVLDFTLPRIVSISPAQAAANVPIDSSIVIVFSEPMDPESTRKALDIDPGVLCEGGWTFSREGDVATCLPELELVHDQDYHITISGKAKDRAGNELSSEVTSYFRTQDSDQPADTTPPTIVGTTPHSSAHGVSQTSPITVTFSEPMNIASAEAAFRIATPAGISGHFDWSGDARTLTFWPSTAIAPGTFVTFEISGEARDLSGNLKGALDRYVFRIVRETTVDLACIPSLEGTIVNTSRTGEELELERRVLGVGDRGNGSTYRAVLSFGLDTLPESLLRIVAADLFAYASAVFGDPISAQGASLGHLAWHHVYFGAELTLDAYGAPSLEHVNNSALLAFDDNRGWKQSSVLESVRDDWVRRGARGSRSQYRLQFETANDGDAISDLIVFGSCSGRASDRPYLRVRYEHP